MRNVIVIFMLSAAFAATACGPTSPEKTSAPDVKGAPAAWSVKTAPVESPAGPNSSEPQLAVSNRGVLLSWTEKAGDKSTLKFAERTASGWSQPMTAASGSGWFVTYADPPTVIRLSDGTLVATWQVTTDEELEAANLNLSYSKDDGKTWARPFLPHHDRTKTQHAFPSFFEVPGTGLGMVWLDGRLGAKDPENGPMSLQYASFDSSWKQTAEAALDTRVCECCSTSTAVTSDGVVAAFRDRSEKEIRNIAVVRLENGQWTTSTPVHDDNWEVHSCPVNGPAISARGRNAVVAWFTAKDDKGQAYAAFSSDAGRTWGSPITLHDDASLGRVDVELLDDGSAVATWVEYADKRGQFRMRRIEPSGMRGPAMAVAAVEGGSSSGFPRMAHRRRGPAELVRITPHGPASLSSPWHHGRTVVCGHVHPDVRNGQLHRRRVHERESGLYGGVDDGSDGHHRASRDARDVPRREAQRHHHGRERRRGNLAVRIHQATDGRWRSPIPPFDDPAPLRSDPDVHESVPAE